jgi:hypothetical protein
MRKADIFITPKHGYDLLPKIRAEVYMIFAFCGEEEAWRRESIAKWR